MANGLLGWRNKVDLFGASISAGSAAGNLPASNVADQAIARPWRTDGVTDTYLEIDFGEDVALRLLAFNGTDIGSSDTVRHRLSSSGAGATGGDKHDSGTINSDVESGYGYHVYDVGSEVSGVRYWRIDINAPSLSSQGYFEVGRAWASPVFQPQINFKYGPELRWEDAASVKTAPRSGVELVDATYTRRYRQFQYKSLTDAESRTVEDMHREAGRRNQVLFVPDPDSSFIQREAILGRLEEISPIQIHDRHPLYNAAAFEIRESK